MFWLYDSDVGRGRLWFIIGGMGLGALAVGYEAWRLVQGEGSPGAIVAIFSGISMIAFHAIIGGLVRLPLPPPRQVPEGTPWWRDLWGVPSDGRNQRTTDSR